MRVYVLSRDFHYEGTGLVGVFATVEAAKTKAESLSKLGKLITWTDYGDGASGCWGSVPAEDFDWDIDAFEVQS